MAETSFPGSPEAVKQGCLCPRMDNNNGRGFMLRGKTVFWQVADCPVHGEPSPAVPPPTVR